MNYYVYVLKSKVNGKTYTGHTENLEKRIKEHNAGKTKSIKPYIPYELVYSEHYNSRYEAIKREKFLKSGIGREFIKSLIK